MADEQASPAPDKGVFNPEGYHSTRWRDGLEVTRVVQHKRQIVLYIHWQGRMTTLRLGPRTAEIERTQVNARSLHVQS